MQTKKDEIKQDILNAATHEFMSKSYNKSSLRVIATKANTTLGNLYNYFPNKEAILDEIVGEIPSKIKYVIDNHNNPELESIINKDNIRDYIDEWMPSFFPLEALLSEPFVILLEGCQGTKYESFKDQLVPMIAEHLADHMNIKGQNFLPQILAQGTLTSILIIAKSKKSMIQKIEDLLDYIIIISFGLPDLKGL